MAKRRFWTDEEDDFLRKFYPDFGKEETARKLSRPSSSVAMRASKLGLKRKVWNSHLTQEVQERVVQLYKSGSLVTQIQKIENLSYHHIKWCLDRAGVQVDRKRSSQFVQEKRKRRFTQGEKSRIQQMWVGNIGIVHIAKEVGCCPQTIEKYVGANLPKRSRSEVIKASHPARTFTQEERDYIAHEFTEGMKTRNALAEELDLSPYFIRQALLEEGVDIKKWETKKRSNSLQKAFLEDRMSIPSNKIYGIPTPCDTPFQGRVTMRSKTEARHGEELNDSGVAWFYELCRYKLSGGSSYLPDFWVTQMSVVKAKKILGANPTKKDIRGFLQNTPYELEDTKAGRFDSEDKSYPKLALFCQEYPAEKFSVLLFCGKTRSRISI